MPQHFFPGTHICCLCDPSNNMNSLCTPVPALHADLLDWSKWHDLFKVTFCQPAEPRSGVINCLFNAACRSSNKQQVLTCSSFKSLSSSQVASV